MFGNAPQQNAHEWLSFADADGTTWLFDVTFLASDWTCIYGRGCKGVLDHDATDLGHGCCTHGAHFADSADRVRVRRHIARLRADQWENRRVARQLGGPLVKNEDGSWVTRTHDGVCVFQNSPDFEGGPGCALHRGALEAGERPLDWKPDVCWQLPLRLETRVDENERVTYVLRQWDRPDWGEGGHEFHWWCTDAPDAFVGHRPVYRELEDEIVELVGRERYDWLVAALDRRPTETFLPHPARLVRQP